MILLTGGAGFIGSVLLGELNRLGYEDIVVVDRLKETSKWRNLRELKFSRYVHADNLFRPEDGDEIFPHVQLIFHMGACSSTTEMDMDYLMDNNVEYSKQLFRLACELEVPIVYASSAATYGLGEKGYSDAHENTPDLRPLNPYGYSKQLFDEWVLKRSKSKNRMPPRWFGVKFFNVFGPNEYHKQDMRSLVHKGYQQIQETGKVKLFKSHKDGVKDGEQLRDFVYVKEVVSAMIEMMKDDKGKAPNGLYNLGTGQARSFYDLIASTFTALGTEINVEFIPMPEHLRAQYQYYTCAEVKKLREAFPGVNLWSLEEAVKDYVQNYLVQGIPYYKV